MNLTITALGWTLVHFLWQGAAIAALLACARYFLRDSRAQSRYAAATVAMLLMLGCAATTFVYMDSGDSLASERAAVQRSNVAAANAVAEPSKPPAAISWRDRLPGYFPVLIYIWIAGVIALSIRSLGGWVIAQMWKRRNVRPASAFWQARMARLQQRLSVSRTVRLWESAIAQTPAVIGWIRPVVLLPASALSGLAPNQIEALLAHEIAHIRRHDYLINLLQTAIETLLFYHPAVWWVGRQMRAERENCCDDLAVAVCGDALVYARALTELEQICSAAPSLAMAANSGSLLDRVRRLLETKPDAGHRASFSHGDWLTGVAIALCVVSLWATSRAPVPRQTNFAAQKVYLVNTVNRERTETFIRQRELRVTQQPRVILAALTEASEQQQESQPPRASGDQSLAGITALGYKDVTVDQLIALKIHGVTTDYVRQLQAAGLKLNIDDIVAFAIHGAHPADIVEMQKLGYKPGAEDVVSMQIHGVTPEFARQMKALGMGVPTLEDLVSFKIHGVTPETAAGFKQAGVRDLSFESLVALEIHGANPANVKEIAALGYANLSADDVVAMCIHGVNPDFVRKVQKHGFKDVSVEKLIKLKQYGILD